MNMLETKARKQGNSVIICLPAQLEVEVNTVFFLSKDKRGNILLVPKINDPYSGSESNVDCQEEAEELWSPEGREVLDE